MDLPCLYDILSVEHILPVVSCHSIDDKRLPRLPKLSLSVVDARRGRGDVEPLVVVAGRVCGAAATDGIGPERNV